MVWDFVFYPPASFLEFGSIVCTTLEYPMCNGLAFYALLIKRAVGGGVSAHVCVCARRGKK